ncbi:hypothetical protein MPTK1_4g01860 [Marchantia polymorpha subsp. ruderalis]|uniref:Uncharacterized protein n=2 Tax=Marchantia polymorpha TaxID=3197 RepID=A0AAF6B5B6_MARPO|nr:hypothetical protein MARPO_0098s0014 [Marchantia polymorpha]BBN07200.1 hypothetical protein Mp_4g01860 [Marchantia polymorpha subsp. ruderalis]|eukprot:PTQ32459.1 hypothetical protein MARPO_0098s0014 [Marchantia polymorpha]
MGEEKDVQGVAEAGTPKAGLKEESTVKDSYDAVYQSANGIAKESEPLSAKSQEQQRARTRNLPKVGVAEDIGCQWKKPSAKSEALAASVGKRDVKDVPAAASNRLVRQQRQWKTAVKVMSRILSSISPIIALRRARDCYVTSLGSVASHVSHSTACGVTYGAGHSSLGTIPAAWRSGSSRFQDQVVESERSLSAAFKASFNDAATQMSDAARSHRRSSSVPVFPPLGGSGLSAAARTPSWRSPSGRAPSASSRFGMQPMAIYTIKEA